MNESSVTRRVPQVGLAFLLSQVGAHAAFTFEERLGVMELKPHHAGLLRMLGANPGLSQQELSDLFGVFPSRLVELLDHLENRAFIERRANPADRRGHRLYLTSAGRKALTTVASLTRKLDRDLCAALSKVEGATLAGMLARIVAQQHITPAVHPAYRKLQERRDRSPVPRKRITKRGNL